MEIYTALQGVSNLSIHEIIVSFMKEKAYKPMTQNELAKVFGIKKNEGKDFKKLLNSMIKEGVIFRTNSDRYCATERLGLVIGKLQGNVKGFGFVIPDEDRPDVFIPASALNGAMNGDRVVCKVLREENHGKKCEGEIQSILERANTKVIGIYEENKGFGFVVPEDKKIYQDVFISKEDRNGAKNGELVVTEITQWPDKRRSPEGKIIEILGKKGDVGIDILTIIKKFKLPEAFPEKVESFVAAIPEEIPAEEIKRRKDFRNNRLFTIDGEDAKDLDDAVSIEKLPNGNYSLGVHIADVSYYVKEKNPLDIEALKRGTSVYLLDRVIPMLPKKLSNGLCSLNPKVDRLSMSCVMEVDNNGKVVDSAIYESIINSTERMTYTDVTKILRDKDEDTMEKYSTLVPDFILMEELCSILNKKRLNRGAIDFDFDESYIKLNENGKPIDIVPYERAIANRIIEEFMLLCNETIAEHMFWANVPFVYRVHEDPDEDKLNHFNEFVHNLGYSVRWGSEVHPKALQELIEKVKGQKEENVVNTLLLRSMKQARYAPQCTGHFGLAAMYYCHFTSPIRRYPDLIIHRIIKEYLKGSLNDARIEALTKAVDYASVQSSETERTAQEAEREVDDLKKAEYMFDKIGEIYDGIISSVTSFGMFVQLPNTVEGLIHISEMYDDYYVYDEKHLTLTGERTKQVYRLGDEIKIKVTNVNIDLREISFGIYNKIEDVTEDEREIFNSYTMDDLEEELKHLKS